MEIASAGYTFAMNAEDGTPDSLTVSGELELGANTTFNATVNVSGEDSKMTGTGSLTLGEGGSLTVDTELKKTSETDGEAYTGTITLNGGKLTAKGSTTVTLGSSGGTLHGSGTGLTASLSGSGALTAEGTLNLTGTAGTLTLANSATVKGDATSGVTVAGIGGGNATDGTATTLGGKITVRDTATTEHQVRGQTGYGSGADGQPGQAEP